MSAPLTAQQAARHDDGDDSLDHFYCCEDENLALCGADVTDSPIVDQAAHPCVVCTDLDVPDACYCPRARADLQEGSPC